ncbi:glycoside hydrolase family 6 protein [Demequina sp.]|uniref:glycoside hydrolase family 6 protein n=1 Tax=Demequina sp. TaxID=2050685 RepID=UPI003A8907AA
MAKTARRATTGVAALALAATLSIAACDFGGEPEGINPTAPGDGGSATEVVTVDGTHVDNAFAGATMYVNHSWSERVLEQADSTDDAALANDMRAIAYTPTAVWMDRISAIEGNADGPGLRHHLDAAVSQAQDADGPVVVTVVIYNLPGRDCFALASNGELPATDEALARYQSEYIDVIAAMFAQEAYRDLRIVTVIEPDSLPNLVTNASEPACQEADPYYRAGVAYALDAFAAQDHVYAYIDAAHSGWLGWDNNAGPTAQLFAEVVRSTEAGFEAVDGFITNTANYTPLEEPFLKDPELQVGGQPVKSGSFYEFNAQFDEADWTADLYGRLVAAGFPEHIGMLIDTSRNGWGGDARPTAVSTSGTLDTFVAESKVDARTHRGGWCNQAGAGLGRLPQALPAGFDDSHLDALVWIKPPGESDGSSTEIANDEGKGFDRMCDPTFTTDRLGGQSTNALADAPVSGKWFSAQFAELVANAYPTVGAPVPAPREDPDASKPVGSSAADTGSGDPEDGARQGGADDKDASDDTAPSTADAGASSRGCDAELVVTNQWDGGFQADVTVVAREQIAGWTVTVVLPSGSSTGSLWNGEATGTSGTFTVGDVGWNGSLAASATGTFGFTGNGSPPAAGDLTCVAH